MTMDWHLLELPIEGYGATGPEIDISELVCTPEYAEIARNATCYGEEFERLRKDLKTKGFDHYQLRDGLTVLPSPAEENLPWPGDHVTNER